MVCIPASTEAWNGLQKYLPSDDCVLSSQYIGTDGETVQSTTIGSKTQQSSDEKSCLKGTIVEQFVAKVDSASLWIKRFPSDLKQESKFVRSPHPISSIGMNLNQSPMIVISVITMLCLAVEGAYNGFLARQEFRSAWDWPDGAWKGAYCGHSENIVFSWGGNNCSEGATDTNVVKYLDISNSTLGWQSHNDMACDTRRDSLDSSGESVALRWAEYESTNPYYIDLCKFYVFNNGSDVTINNTMRACSHPNSYYVGRIYGFQLAYRPGSYPYRVWGIGGAYRPFIANEDTYVTRLKSLPTYVNFQYKNSAVCYSQWEDAFWKFGGYSYSSRWGTRYKNFAVRYDVDSNTTSTVTSLLSPARYDMRCFSIMNGTLLLLFGGKTSSGYYSGMDVFDTRSQTFSAAVVSDSFAYSCQWLIDSKTVVSLTGGCNSNNKASLIKLETQPADINYTVTAEFTTLNTAASSIAHLENNITSFVADALNPGSYHDMKSDLIVYSSSYTSAVNSNPTFTVNIGYNGRVIIADDDSFVFDESGIASDVSASLQTLETSGTNMFTGVGSIAATVDYDGAVTFSPTAAPTRSWTYSPTDPTETPTGSPSQPPTAVPTNSPTQPTTDPTAAPTQPTTDPTAAPTLTPTMPTNSPTLAPTSVPTPPSDAPTWTPTRVPTATPTSAPTSPTDAPTAAPTLAPTDVPTSAPTSPTDAPTSAPTRLPTDTPTGAPTYSPSDVPTAVPSDVPTDAPTSPTDAPTSAPTRVPTDVPTNVPTNAPSDVPTTAPSDVPSNAPTRTPSDAPSAVPSDVPTNVPTEAPSDAPTVVPSDVPTDVPSDAPSYAPVMSPSGAPSFAPTDVPSDVPTDVPTDYPTNAPSYSPSNAPSDAPTNVPTNAPSSFPSDVPTAAPTAAPTWPTAAPTYMPSRAPSNSPTAAPTEMPTEFVPIYPLSIPQTQIVASAIGVGCISAAMISVSLWFVVTKTVPVLKELNQDAGMEWNDRWGVIGSQASLIGRLIFLLEWTNIASDCANTAEMITVRPESVFFFALLSAIFSGVAIILLIGNAVIHRIIYAVIEAVRRRRESLLDLLTNRRYISGLDEESYRVHINEIMARNEHTSVLILGLKMVGIIVSGLEDCPHIWVSLIVVGKTGWSTVAQVSVGFSTLLLFLKTAVIILNRCKCYDESISESSRGLSNRLSARRTSEIQMTDRLSISRSESSRYGLLGLASPSVGEDTVSALSTRRVSVTASSSSDLFDSPLRRRPSSKRPLSRRLSTDVSQMTVEEMGTEFI